MKHFLAALFLALPCGAADDRDRALYVLRTVTHAHVKPKAPPETERRRLVHDLWSACLELCGTRGPAVFRFALAVAWKEGSVTWDWHDSGIGWGPWAVQRQEVEAACDRLGLKRKGAWERFQRDRRYAVWLSVEHFRELLVRSGWKPREAAMVHHKWTRWTWIHKRAYLPGILFFHEEMFGRVLPNRLDETISGSVGSDRFGPE